MSNLAELFPYKQLLSKKDNFKNNIHLAMTVIYLKKKKYKKVASSWKLEKKMKMAAILDCSATLIATKDTDRFGFLGLKMNFDYIGVNCPERVACPLKYVSFFK